MEFGVIGRDVVCSLVAGRVFELHIRKLLGDLDRRVHVAKGRGEDDIAAFTGETLDRALCIRTFRHTFKICGFQLVAEMLFRIKTALVVLIGPTEVANWSNVDKAGFDVCSVCGRAGSCEGNGGNGCFQKRFHLVLSPLFRSLCCDLV